MTAWAWREEKWVVVARATSRNVVVVSIVSPKLLLTIDGGFLILVLEQEIYLKTVLLKKK